VLSPHPPASLHPPIAITERESTELRSQIRRLIYTNIGHDGVEADFDNGSV